ncbi:sodium/panthothenate symporter [compost metagenome]|jgi:sodium/pantothenate symporter
MVTGALCYTLLASFGLQLAGLHPIVPSLLLSLLAFYLGNVYGEKRQLASSLPS